LFPQIRFSGLIQASRGHGKKHQPRTKGLLCPRSVFPLWPNRSAQLLSMAWYMDENTGLVSHLFVLGGDCRVLAVASPAVGRQARSSSGVWLPLIPRSTCTTVGSVCGPHVQLRQPRHGWRSHRPGPPWHDLPSVRGRVCRTPHRPCGGGQPHLPVACIWERVAFLPVFALSVCRQSASVVAPLCDADAGHHARLQHQRQVPAR